MSADAARGAAARDSATAADSSFRRRWSWRTRLVVTVAGWAIAFVLRVLRTPRREVMPRAFAALKAVGLSARAQAYPHQLSQGEAQRAALARALAKSPALIVADEPTGNLDDDMAAEILEVLKDIWKQGTTVLLATHQARVATQLNRRTITLSNGQLVKDEG